MTNLSIDSLYDRMNIDASRKLVEKLQIVKVRHERDPGPEIGNFHDFKAYSK